MRRDFTEARELESPNCWLYSFKEFPGLQESRGGIVAQALLRRYGITTLKELKVVDLDGKEDMVERAAASHLWENIHDANPTFGKRTMSHIRFFLSGIFEFAKDKNYYVGESPAVAALPEGLRPGKRGAVYSQEDLNLMLGALQERKRDVKNLLAQAVLAVAFGTGLRKGELQGLKWEHSKLLKDGSAKIAVEQSVWHGQIVGVKTESSADEVTLGPDFVEYVEQYRAAIGGLNSGFMFGYSGGRPIDLDSFRKWVMLPLLNRCAVYKKPESQHGERFRLSSGSRDEARVQT